MLLNSQTTLAAVDILEEPELDDGFMFLSPNVQNPLTVARARIEIHLRSSSVCALQRGRSGRGEDETSQL